MNEIAKPLYTLFTRLRLAELPLGLDDYALLLQALAAGRGATREELARLCRALWVRTADPALLRLFRSDFERIIPRDYGRLTPTPTPIQKPEKPSTDPTKDESESSKTDPQSKSEQQETKNKEKKENEEKQKREDAKVSQFQAGHNLDEFGHRQMGFEVSQEIDVTTQAFYSFSSDYLPITARQMKQNWRYLRRAARFGPPVDLDVTATVQKIAQEGMMTDPVLRPRRVNRTDLVLLLDYGGSMVPFHRLAARLAETAVRGGRLGQAAIYYFHDCPIGHFYHDPAFLEPELIINRLQKMHALHSSILIFSDGGAARGNYDPQRIKVTQSFLALLRHVVRNVAWLNPMPEGRWPQTSADAIAQAVPMFEANPAGVHSAIKTLRGHNPHALERK